MWKYFALLLISSSPLFAVEQDWLLVPGVRAGMITADSSLDQLKKEIGENNLKEEKSSLAGETEGEEGPVTIIYPSEPEKTAMIKWKDKKLKTKPDLIIISQKPMEPEIKSKWKSSEGVTLGTTLEALQKLNGTPFLFMEFASDVGGNIFSWEGGKLSKYTSKLWVTLGEPYSRVALSAADEKTLNTKREYKSNDKIVRKLKPRVVMLRLEF